MQHGHLLCELHLAIRNLILKFIDLSLLLLNDCGHSDSRRLKLLSFLVVLVLILCLHLRRHLLVVRLLVLRFFISSGFFFHLHLQILK